jgi:hypothetical protein
MQCSGDLHHLLDCKGRVVSTCNTGEGCAREDEGLACIAACDAAQANKASIGCDYYVHEISPVFAQQAICSAVTIVNTWDTPVSLSAEAQGVQVDLQKAAYLLEGRDENITYEPIPPSGIPAGKMAIVFLHGRCPRSPLADSAPPEWTDPAPMTSLSGHALHVTTSAPVVAYDFVPFNGGSSAMSSATLLLPVSAWDTSYVAVTPYPLEENCTNPGFTVIASADATEVTVLPSVAIAGNGGDIPASQGNVPRTFTLGKGQTLRLSQPEDLVGSIVRSNKPVGLWADQEHINVDYRAADSAHQQIPAVSKLGHEYAGVRYQDRLEGKEESPPWRIVGLVKDTVLTWDPGPPAGAPTTIGAGEVKTFHAAGPFVVKSQDAEHPFYMNAYMTGGAGFEAIGDAEFVNMVPTAQYLSRYPFFTDPTYKTTSLVFVRARENVTDELKDVELDCPGALSGWNGVVDHWKPIGTSGKLEYAYVNFQEKGCEDGVHEARSEGPFGLTVWGWDEWSSYAYPAATGLRNVNGVVINPIPR